MGDELDNELIFGPFSTARPTKVKFQSCAMASNEVTMNDNADDNPQPSIELALIGLDEDEVIEVVREHERLKEQGNDTPEREA